MRKERIYLLVIALTFPLFLFVNVWQTMRYRDLLKEVSVLEEKQIALIEKNKKALASLAFLESPERIEDLAIDKLDLELLKRENRTQIFLPGGQDDGN